MTVQSSVSRISYSGDGSTTAFSVNFYFLVNGDLRVIVRSSDGVETVQTLGTHYTVSGAGNPNGGTVTFVTAPASGTTVVIVRDPPTTQLTAYNNQDPFPASSHERALDKLTMLIQRREEKLNRAILLKESSSLSSLTYPDPEAGKLLRWNASANGIENATLADGTETLPTTANRFLHRNAAGTAFEALTYADARDRLDVPVYVATRTALKALDTTKDAAASLTEAGREGQFLWNGTNLSATLTPQSITSTAVDATTDTITSAAHALQTGHAVFPTSTVNGVTVDVIYYAIRVTVDTFKLATTYANAIAGTAVDLTGTTNFTVRYYIDPAEGVYVVPTGKARDGSQGAWVRAGVAGEVRATWFGALGTGAGDDSAAMQAAIYFGFDIDFGSGTYNVISLNFNQANRLYKGNGAVLVFKGNTTNRLANINASGVTFDGVIFDGDLRQPRMGLVRVNDNCAAPTFINGAVRNMLGTVAGTEATNAMSGISISPYGVTDIFVHNMDFENLRKSNDGTYYAITEGYGFVSGIDFGLEGGGDTSTAQVVPSGGIISGNRFNIIETILAAGSTNNDVAIYDDAQAIRTISNESGSYSLDLLIAGNAYRRCSKRALKIRHSGVVCVDNVVWSDQSAFRMSAVFDIAHDSVLRNSTVYVTDEAKIPAAIAKIEAGLGQAATANRFAVIDGLEAEACVTLVEITGVFAGRPLENMTLRNVTCPRVSSYGLITTGNAPSTLRNNVVEGWRIQGLGDVARAINWAVTDGNGNCGLTVRDFEAINMDVAIIGHDADLDIRLKVTSAAFAGTGSATLFRYSAPAFAAGSRPSRIRSIDIDALGISDAYLAARSLGLVYISAPRLVVDLFKMEVRDDLPTTTRHATFGGTDTSFKSIDYYGPGNLFIGVNDVALRFEIDKATRRGGGATSASFLYFNNGSNDLVAIHNVKDFRPSTGSTIDIVNGVAGTPYEIDGVRSRTTATNVVSGASLAVLNNVTKF